MAFFNLLICNLLLLQCSRSTLQSTAANIYFMYKQAVWVLNCRSLDKYQQTIFLTKNELLSHYSWLKNFLKLSDDFWHRKFTLNIRFWHFLTNCLCVDFWPNVLLFRTQTACYMKIKCSLLYSIQYTPTKCHIINFSIWSLTFYTCLSHKVYVMVYIFKYFLQIETVQLFL